MEESFLANAAASVVVQLAGENAVPTDRID